MLASRVSLQNRWGFFCLSFDACNKKEMGTKEIIVVITRPHKDMNDRVVETIFYDQAQRLSKTFSLLYSQTE